LTGNTTVVESSRDRASVLFDMARIIRRMNRRPDRGFAASLHLTADELIVHFHCPLILGECLAVETFEAAEPMRQIEHAIWQTGGVA
jgi:hypothetical protein